MTKTTHRVYIVILSLLVISALIFLIIFGLSYYNTSIEERFFHPDYNFFKPSGIYGHGLGIMGSLLILIGVLSYILRKRLQSLSRLGLLKHWLEFHIFLCTLGPVMILFHTSFKFGGIVAISFWSMVAVFVSGVIGRFIYIQIPRTIEGRELSLSELKNMKTDLSSILLDRFNLDEISFQAIIATTKKEEIKSYKNFIVKYLRNYQEDQKDIKKIKKLLKENNLPGTERKKVIRLIKNELSMNRRIERLLLMQNLFKYWHVAHLPFALVMLIIMIIHVIVTMVFGFKWIF